MASRHLNTLIQHLRRCVSPHGDDTLSDSQLLECWVRQRDEAAFEVLLWRHGPMVFSVCRRLLRDGHDVEDAFQAAFLTLVRKGASIRRPQALAAWLYRVAYRIALRLREETAVRLRREQPGVETLLDKDTDETGQRDLRAVVDEEIDALPDRYRQAFVLCYLEGKTHEEAAQLLGRPMGTVSCWLKRGRERLRQRLVQRGLAPALLVAVGESEARAIVPSALVKATGRAASVFAAGGESATGAVSARVAALMEGAVRGMAATKLQWTLVLSLTLSLAATGTGMWVHQPPSTQSPRAKPDDETAASSQPKQQQEQAERTDHDGDPLPVGAVARLGTLRFRHSNSINRIGIGADGTSVLSSAGTAVYVWDLAKGKERRRFRHEKPVEFFACSRDGKLLASGCHEGTIHVWDIATGREIRHFMAHQGRARDWIGPNAAYVMDFAPDNRHIISMGSDGSFRLWDAESGEKIREFGHFSNLAGAALSPDGKTLAGVAKNDKTWELRLWEVATGRVLKQRPQPGKQILSPAFSPDGKMLAISIGEEDSNKPCDIQVWDADASKIIRTLRGHKRWAWCLFAPDSKTLLSTGDFDGGRQWDVATGKEVGRVGDHTVDFNQLLFCPDGRTLVSYKQNNHHVRFWDRATGKEVRSSGDAVSPIDYLGFSPDGRLLVAGSKTDWGFRLWDVAARRIVRRLEHGSLMGLCFSPEGSRLASTAFRDTQVRIWDVDNGKELRRITTNEGDKFIECMAWSGDGKTLATSRSSDPIRLWNAETGKPLRELSADRYQIETLAFSPDGRTLAALGNEIGPQNKTLLLFWTVDTGKPLPPLEAAIGFGNPGFYAHPRLAFSPDGRTLAAGGQGVEASIFLWEMASGRLRLTLKHGEDVASLAFSPDGKLLAAANNLRNALELVALGQLSPQEKSRLRPPRVHLWDMTAERELTPLDGHQGSITSLSFSPDGKLLATGGNDTTVLLWDATRFQTKPPAEVKLQPKQLELLWADLDGEDAAKAYRAIRTFAAAPKSSLAFFKRHLKPVTPVDANKVASLLDDLDSDQFSVREKAMQQLEKLGPRVAAELLKTLAANPPLEVRRRIEQLLEKQNAAKQIRMIRALEALERMVTPDARDLCAALAAGVADAPLTRQARAALRRMAR